MKQEKFNLSEKIEVINGLNFIFAPNVKEFIRRLKKLIENYLNFDDEFKDMVLDKINKLAGDKLK